MPGTWITQAMTHTAPEVTQEGDTAPSLALPNTYSGSNQLPEMTMGKQQIINLSVT